jgi:hypothetical protein
MGFFKKNLTFTVVVVVCLLAFGAGAYLAFAQAGKIDQAKQTIQTAESRLNNLRFADPAPTEANVQASRENVAELKAVLKSIREDLQQGSRLSTTTDGIAVMAGIQQYISDYQRMAAAQTDGNGAPDSITVPKDFAFGFEQYFKQATPPGDARVAATLDKQRQILSYLLNKLFAADPASIVSVKREVLERPTAGGRGEGSGDKGFQINKAVSARVPGAIDTLAFSLTFTGYTDSLRGFLNNLAKFELPIVVRSIEVTRPTGSQTTSAPAANANNLDAIFGVFGGAGEAAKEAPKEAQKPVIAENISTFTVVLEFIEIVLPADSAEDKV